MPHQLTLTLDPQLEARLTELANHSGLALDVLATKVLEAHASEQERLFNEQTEDEQRWQEYVSTGTTIPYQTVRSKLQRLAAHAAQKANTR